MRLKRIEIPAYGPFSGLAFDLPASGSDFHLVYGPNEAGKSSLLRAIRALLFGIHAQTADNFIHDYKDLRIAAELERRDGAKRVFQRRKGRGNTLLDAAGNAIPDSDLAEFLGVVDEAYFDSMFGLGGRELREGADELLRGEGKLGQALFSASLGGTPVDRVVQSLEAEAGQYFSGRARRSIREAAATVKDLRKEARNSLVRPEAWEEVERELARHRDRRQALVDQKNEGANRLAWLERCRDALPFVGQLAEQGRLLAEMPALPALPESFADDIRQSRDAWQRARDLVAQHDGQLASLRERAAACRLSPEILAEAAAIETLLSEGGVYRENHSQRTEKLAEAEQTKTRVVARSVDLGISASIDELEGYRVTEPDFLSARETIDALVEADRQRAANAERRESLQREIDQLKAEHPAAIDSGELARLEAAVNGAEGLRETATEMAAKKATQAALHAGLKDRHRLLTGAPGDFEAVCRLAVPQRTTIDRFREEFEDGRRRAEALEESRLARQSERDGLETDIRRLTRQRDLPTLEDLSAARADRDHGWDLVLGAWKGGDAGEDPVDGRPLEEAYPEMVTRADDLADRLRAEAETVAQIEEKRTQVELAEKALRTLAEQEATHREARAALESEWRRAWEPTGVSPLSPAEMREWRENWDAFTRQVGEWRAGAEEIEKREAAVAAATADLSEVLGTSGGTLSSLLDTGRTRIDQLKKAIGAAGERDRQIEAKAKTLEELAAARPELEARADEARSAWESVRERLALPGDLSPVNALEILRGRREMLQEYDRWRELVGECDRRRDRIEAYEAGVTRLAERLKLGSGKVEALVDHLRTALQEARAEQVRHDGIREQIAQGESGRDEARLEVTRNREAFDALLGQAGLADEGELNDFLTRFESRARHRKRIEELRETLAGLARGESVDDFVALVEAEDGGTLEGEIASLEAAIATLDGDIEQARSDLQEWETRRQTMEKASDEAARHTQEAELAAARIRQDADRFVRLQLALSILRSRIDQFREQNQGPFVEKASRWFREITGESFAGITTSYDAGDEPVIAGLRSGEATGGQTVLVDGMSEGTRDQLFLALRFAGLELHLAEHEPMPMILDDLLVHFDDGRSRQALGALSQLGRQSQVLLFTHHAHLVELARDHLGDDGFHLTELSGRGR